MSNTRIDIFCKDNEYEVWIRILVGLLKTHDAVHPLSPDNRLALKLQTRFVCSVRASVTTVSAEAFFDLRLRRTKSALSDAVHTLG